MLAIVLVNHKGRRAHGNASTGMDTITYLLLVPSSIATNFQLNSCVYRFFLLALSSDVSEYTFPCLPHFIVVISSKYPMSCYYADGLNFFSSCFAIKNRWKNKTHPLVNIIILFSLGCWMSTFLSFPIYSSYYVLSLCRRIIFFLSKSSELNFRFHIQSF